MELEDIDYSIFSKEELTKLNGIVESFDYKKISDPIKKFEYLKKRDIDEHIIQYGLVVPEPFCSTEDYLSHLQQKQKALEMICSRVFKEMDENGLIVSREQLEDICFNRKISKQDLEKGCLFRKQKVTMKQTESDELFNSRFEDCFIYRIEEFGYQFYNNKEITIYDQIYNKNQIGIENFRPFQLFFVCPNGELLTLKSKDFDNPLSYDLIENWIFDVIEHQINTSDGVKHVVVLNNKYQSFILKRKSKIGFKFHFVSCVSKVINEIIIKSIEETNGSLPDEIMIKCEENIKAALSNPNTLSLSPQLIFGQFKEHLTYEQKLILEKVLVQSTKRIKKFVQRQIPSNGEVDKEECFNFLKGQEFQELENGFIQFLVVMSKYPQFSHERICSIFKRKLPTFKNLLESPVMIEPSLFSKVTERLREQIQQGFVITPDVFDDSIAKKFQIEKYHVFDSLIGTGEFKGVMCRRTFEIDSFYLEKYSEFLNRLQNAINETEPQLVYCIGGFHSIIHKSLPFLSLSLGSFIPSRFDLTKKFEDIICCVSGDLKYNVWVLGIDPKKTNKKVFNPKENEDNFKFLGEENSYITQKESCSILDCIIEEIGSKKRKFNLKTNGIIIVDESWESFGYQQKDNVNIYYLREILNERINPLSLLISGLIIGYLRENSENDDLEKIASDSQFDLKLIYEGINKSLIQQCFNDCGFAMENDIIRCDKLLEKTKENIQKITRVYQISFRDETIKIDIQNIGLLYRPFVVEQLELLKDKKSELSYDEWINFIKKRYQFFSNSGVEDLNKTKKCIERTKTEIFLQPQKRGEDPSFISSISSISGISEFELRESQIPTDPKRLPRFEFGPTHSLHQIEPK